MNGLSHEEIMKMQERAILHAKDMQKRASIKNPQSCAPPKNKKTPKEPLKEAQKSEPKALPHNITSTKVPCSKQILPCQEPPIMNFGTDDERLMLLSFILILIFDKADKILILALIYIML